MDDVRCPMCGRPNSPDADVCEFCDARLKPLRIEPFSENSFSKDEDFPEWLKSIQLNLADNQDPISSDDDIPDWLKDLRSEGSELDSDPDNEDSSDQSMLLEPDAFDILNDISSKNASPSENENDSQGGEPIEDEDPDWIHKIHSSDIPINHSEPIQNPDWLEKLSEDYVLEEPAKPVPDDVTFEPSIEAQYLKGLETNSGRLDWFEDVIPDRDQEMEDDTVADQVDETTDESGISDNPQITELQPTNENFLEIANSLPDDVSASQNFADDLEDFQIFPLSAIGEDEQLFGSGGLDEIEEDLSWLTQTTPVEFGEPSDNDVNGFDSPVPLEIENLAESNKVLDVLSEYEESEPDDLRSEYSNEKYQAEISSAELPGWLRAMRPVGALKLDDGGVDIKEQAEKAGPLAGLLGALPAEPEISQASKPPTYSLKLRVSETQQANALLLGDLIRAEGESKVPDQKAFLKTQNPLRIFFGLILYAIVIAVLLSGFPSLQRPAISAEVFSASQLVVDLPSDSPVLVAVDYAPGFSNELESNLVVMAEHLLSKGAHLTFVSSLPTGPIQAEILVSRISTARGFPAGFAYTNLGFIPGGSSGILAFAEEPQRIMPIDTNGKSAWNSMQLQRVTRLGDFSMAIIATENPDVSRIWIEQIRPLMANTPIVMVVSSQNEPIVRPYYDAFPRQIQGLIGGISAAVEYETLIGMPGSISGLWSSYAAALSAATGLFILGIFINLIAGKILRSRTKLSKGGKL